MSSTSPYFEYSLQTDDFSVAERYTALREACPQSGAIVTFSGLVRDIAKSNAQVECIELQTYAAMTTQQIQDIGSQLLQRFDIDGVDIIHRYGKLHPCEQIVYVGIASKHRVDAFSAAEMAMDFLKSQVAFWKKEYYNNGDDPRWIEPTAGDHDALSKWSTEQL